METRLRATCGAEEKACYPCGDDQWVVSLLSDGTTRYIGIRKRDGDQFFRTYNCGPDVDEGEEAKQAIRFALMVMEIIDRVNAHNEAFLGYLFPLIDERTVFTENKGAMDLLNKIAHGCHTTTDDHKARVVHTAFDRV